MAVGFVLVSVVMGREREVYDALKEVEGVVDCHPLFGEYDIIAKIDTPTYDDVGKLVVEKVRKIAGVVDTRTLIRINDDSM